MPTTDLLRRLPLFAGLPDAELASIAAVLRSESVPDGHTIVRRGRPAEIVGIIVSGQAAVRVDGRDRTRLGPGDHLGEISGLAGGGATADVVALGPVTYLTVPAAQAEGFLLEHPGLLLAMLKAEARRVGAPGRWFAGATPAPGDGSWTPDAWRASPALQQPNWPDAGALEAAVRTIAERPPLVFPGEIRQLESALAEVAAGRAFLLQAGDCAESFAGFSTDAIRRKLQIMLQMAVVLTYGCGVHVVKVGRIAGQFGKPRSSDIEVVDGVELPSYRGHIVNDDAPTIEARTPDPGRLVAAYERSVATLNLLRAFTTGGFADLSQVHTWNMEFVASSSEGRRYEVIASEIDRALRFMRACGIDVGGDPRLHAVDLWTSHEALILPYEEALVRRDPASDGWCAGSAHMLWIGERTRDPEGAHVAFLAGVRNPIGCKIGPAATPDDVIALCERLDPQRRPGRLTLIARMGAAKVADALPPLLAAVRAAGHPVVWACDPMHGNTITVSGRKTRRFDDILAEIDGFFAACASESVWPGGVHVELTDDDVTECLGGAEAVRESDLPVRYTTTCDPRLNGRQSLDLAFRLAELLRA